MSVLRAALAAIGRPHGECPRLVQIIPLKYGRRQVHSRKFSRTAIDRAQLFLLFAVPGCRRDAVTHDTTTCLGGSFAPSDPASLSSQPTRSKPLSIAAPPQALGLGDTCATSLCLRAARSATMGAATRLARLCSDLAAAAGPRLGSGKAPALATARRCLVRCQSHVPVLPVRPHDARARARISSCITRFDRFRPFSRVQRPNRYAVTQARNHRRQRSPNPAYGYGDRVVIYLPGGLEP